MIAVDRSVIQGMISQITGLVQYDELLRLAEYAHAVKPPNCIVVIGSYRGLTDIALATFSDAPIYSIDWHAEGEADGGQFNDADRQAWTENVLTWKVAHKVRPVSLNSRVVGQIWNEPIGLLFVDGSHSQSAVRDDLAGFMPHVIEGGIVALHDLPAVDKPDPNNGPSLAVQERRDLELVEGVLCLTGFYRKRSS